MKNKTIFVYTVHALIKQIFLSKYGLFFYQFHFVNLQMHYNDALLIVLTTVFHPRPMGNMVLKFSAKILISILSMLSAYFFFCHVNSFILMSMELSTHKHQLQSVVSLLFCLLFSFQALTKRIHSDKQLSLQYGIAYEYEYVYLCVCIS